MLSSLAQTIGWRRFLGDSMQTHSTENPVAPGADAFDERSRDEVPELTEEMLALQEVLAGLKELGAALDDVELRPSAARTDWAAHHERIGIMEKRVRAVLLKPLEAGISVLDDGESRDNILDAVASVVADYAVLVHVSGAPDTDALALLAEAVGVATERLRPELKEGLRSLNMYAQLSAARWHLRQGNRQIADDAAQLVVDGGAPPLLMAGAREILDAPRPLRSAPSLFTFNGFGTGLYGSRDPGPDGSVVKTYALCGLFIPLIPLSAYRVMDHGGGSYSFLHKDKLSGFAKGWLLAIPALIMLAFAGSAASDYLSSSKVVVPKTVEAAQAALKGGDGKKARRELEQLFLLHGMYAEAEALDKAALAYAQALAEEVASPMTVDDLERARWAAAHFKRHVPAGAQFGAGGAFLTKALERWSHELGERDDASLAAAGELLALAYEAAPGPDARRVEQKQLDNKLVSASRTAQEWPLDALRPYAAALPSPAAVDGMAHVFDRIPTESTLWIGYAPEVEAWLVASSSSADLDDSRAHATEGLRSVERPPLRAARLAALTSGNVKKLGRFLEKHPHEQDARHMLADIHLQRGKPRAAARVLQVEGGAGMLMPTYRTTLVTALRGTGDLDEATRILTPLVGRLVHPFIATGKAFDARIKAIQEPLLTQLRFGTLPADLEGKLYGRSDAEQKDILTRWLQAKIDADPEVQRYRGEMMALSAAVGIGITWAELQMDRAEETTSGARVAALKTARKMLDDLVADGEGRQDFMAAARRLSDLGG